MFIRSVKVGLSKMDNSYKITALSHVVAMLFRHVQLKKHCRIATVCYCCKHCFTNILPFHCYYYESFEYFYRL